MSTPDQPPHMPHSLGALLLDQVRHRGHQPLLTFYGDATGERTELSYATFDNWASKTANLLAEECDAGPGTRVALGVTAHWTGAAIVAAAWKLGAIIVPAGAEAEVAVVREEDSDAGGGGGGVIVVGAGMGGRVTGEVTGIAYGDEVLAFGDDYDDPGVTLDDAALVADGRTSSQAELLRTAWGSMTSDGRLLSTAGLESADGLTLGLLAPIAAGASVVWCPGMSDQAAARHAENERATHRLVGGAVEAL